MKTSGCKCGLWWAGSLSLGPSQVPFVNFRYETSRLIIIDPEAHR
jgi:hypothetical protein